MLLAVLWVVVFLAYHGDMPLDGFPARHVTALSFTAIREIYQRTQTQVAPPVLGNLCPLKFECLLFA